MRTLLLTIGILGLSSPVFGDDGVVFCYWGAWANERPGLGRFGVGDLPRDMCTHLVYSFIGLNEEGTLTFPENETVLEGKSNLIDDFLALREENFNLKMLVAIGGWLEGSEDFSIVSNNDTLRATFVANLVSYVGERGFDGLDVDWEYPAQRGGADTDVEAFVWLLRDLKAEFEPRGWLLTSAVDVTQDHIDLSYDVPGISQYLDYINLMTYDLQGPYDSVTRAHAALYPQLTDDPDVIYNTHAGVNVWINNGAPASKLVLGLPNYGRAFNLTSLDQTSTAAQANGPGEAGVFTGEAGFWSYYEICLHQRGNVWSITEVEGNYVYGNFGHFWIGYDNENTIYAKAAYAKRSGLAGIMYWAVDLDDFAGYCGPAYPLIREGIQGWTHSGVMKQTVSVMAILAAVAALIGQL